jgi:hypothetical protein
MNKNIIDFTFIFLIMCTYSILLTDYINTSNEISLLLLSIYNIFFSFIIILIQAI